MLLSNQSCPCHAKEARFEEFLDGSCKRFFTAVPRRLDGKRERPLELKVWIDADALIEGEPVKGVAEQSRPTPEPHKTKHNSYYEG